MLQYSGYWFHLKQLPKKNRIASILTLISFGLYSLALIASIFNINNIFVKPGALFFLIFFILGLVFNFFSIMVLWIGVTYENEISIDLDVMLNTGFGFGITSWPMLILGNLFGSLDPNASNLLFFYISESLFIIICIFQIISILIMRIDIETSTYDGAKFRTCPNCHKLIVAPSNFCVYCGRNVEKE